MEKISDTLRRELRGVGQTHVMVAQGCDLSPSSISRFAAGHSGLSLDAADRLANYLGLLLVSESDWRRRESVWRLWCQGRLTRADPKQGGG